MRFALVLHPFREDAATIAASFASEALARGHSVQVSEDDAPRVPAADVRPSSSPVSGDVVVGVGGDGTVLEAVRQSIVANAPVLGINAGHVGFLTEVERGRIPEALDTIAAGKFTLSERMTLSAHLPGRDPILGVNDAVIEKAVSQHIVRVGVWVGDERLVGYRADGIVVATPTGSTAYNFSAGGPLVDPELDALVVTPVAPHTLFGRPIVFGSGVRLRFEIEGERAARVNIDGRAEGGLAPGEAVEIVCGEHRARFLRLTPRNFARSVREKFHLHDA